MFGLAGGGGRGTAVCSVRLDRGDIDDRTPSHGLHHRRDRVLAAEVVPAQVDTQRACHHMRMRPPASSQRVTHSGTGPRTDSSRRWGRRTLPALHLEVSDLAVDIDAGDVDEHVQPAVSFSRERHLATAAHSGVDPDGATGGREGRLPAPRRRPHPPCRWRRRPDPGPRPSAAPPPARERTLSIR